MLERAQVLAWLGEYTSDADFFVVEVQLRPGEILEVDVDRDGGISSDECGAVCRFLNERIEAQGEDWCVTVGSPGLTSPMRHARQYRKNVGQEVEVLLAGGKKVVGTLVGADEEAFRVCVQEKVRLEGKKRPEMVAKEYAWGYGEVKQVVVKVGKR